MQTKTLIVVPNGKVWASAQQAEALEALIQTRKGGFARVYGYKPTSDWDTSPVQDIVAITRFSTEKLYERKTKAVNGLTFADVKDAIAKNPKLKALSLTEQEALFNERKAMVVDSMAKTLDGDRDDAHRQGHDRCYLHLAPGVKVNYDTVKGKDGLMQPVLTDGFPTVASIMLSYLENSKVTRVEGVRKVVNSGAPKLMSNAIDSVLNKKSVALKMLSLKEDNFERLVIDGEVVLCEDVAGLV
jgi:hypothetical protein